MYFPGHPLRVRSRMKTFLRKRTAQVALAIVALLTVAGGVAYATIPDSNKVFSACMLNTVGTIRLIDKSLPDSNPMSHCSSTLETPSEG